MQPQPLSQAPVASEAHAMMWPHGFSNWKFKNCSLRSQNETVYRKQSNTKITLKTMGKFSEFFTSRAQGFANAWKPIVDWTLQQTPAGAARQNTDKTIQANKEMAEYQYSKDLEMWNRGNMYNSPEEQMKRLKEAGLNPNLIYGSGGGATVAGQLPKYNAPTQNFSYQPAVNVPQMIGMFQDIQVKNAQIDNLKAQHENILNTSNLKSIMGDVKGQERDWLKGYGYFDQGNGKVEIRPRGMALLDTQFSSKQQGLRNLEKQYEAIMAGTRAKEAGADYTRAQTDWITGNAMIKLLGPWVGKMIPGAGTIGARGAKGTFNRKYK